MPCPTFFKEDNTMETYGLEALGIINASNVYRNLTPAQLTEHALRRGEGKLSNTGALVVKTGKYTGRAANDKFIVDLQNEFCGGEVGFKPFPHLYHCKFYNIGGRALYRSVAGNTLAESHQHSVGILKFGQVASSAENSGNKAV